MVLVLFIEVHRSLGPGLPEAVYESALAIELAHRSIPFVRQMTVPIRYRDTEVGAHVLDLLVEDQIVVALKSARNLEDIHFVTLRSYLKATGREHGHLLNFAKPTLEIKRVSTRSRPDPCSVLPRLAGGVVFGSLSEIDRTCGAPTCRCYGPGPKHGPHLQIGWPGDNGKTTGCYVPIAAQPHIRAGANDWQSVRMALRELGAFNRDAIIAEARDAKAAARRPRTGTPLTTGRERPRHAETGA